MKLVIPGEFPTLNEVIKVSKSHFMAYATMKKTYTNLTIAAVKGNPEIKFKADYIFTWYRKTRRNDPDNIQTGTKFILDGMVDAGLIKNDGWNEINSIKHKFGVDRDDPRVEIEIKEVIT